MEWPASRVTVALAAALLGFLAVLAARQPPRAARDLRRLELVDLIRDQDGRVRRLRNEVRSLEAEFAAGTDTAEVRRLRRLVEAASARAGGGPVEGPGVVVILDDSSARRSPTGDPGDLIVHERDIQAVVNALWAGGAEAVAVNGERLTAMSAVRCAGNTLLLHGALHSPPYRIAAIGDPFRLGSSLPGQPGIGRLMASAREVGLRFDIERRSARLGGLGPSPLVELARPRPA
jgi:uncharacterized protein YlxW (UPF0749 family)